MASKEKIEKLRRIAEKSERNAAGTMERDIDALRVYSDVDPDELRAYMQIRLKTDLAIEEGVTKEAVTANPFSRVSLSQLQEIIGSGNDIIALGAKLELANREFFYFCHLRAPDFYKPDRTFLVQLCRELQAFFESDEPVMIIAEPPRHGKSRTAGLFVQWVFGKNQTKKVMTGSYNATLSTTFSKTVRNGIQEEKADRNKIVYSDIFPDVRIQRGDGAMNLWALEGQYASYLATSPDGTATGFGGSLIIIDDLIKNAYEAFNDNILEDQWKWFTDTMLSRLEEGGKIIIIMTRWSSKDLAGRAIDYYEGKGVSVRKLVMKALQDDGTMLCPQILSRESYDLKVGAMSEEIASANYQQIPVDVKGRLYQTLKTYSAIPVDNKGRELSQGTYNYTDTADEGNDFLCSIDYKDVGGEAYITNVIYTQDGMEITEPAVADMLVEDKVNVADIESNGGGRGFARNVETHLRKKGCRRCVVKWFHQSANKRARILTGASWVMEHVYFPVNWRDRWPEFYRDVNKYQKAGKNAHDDAPDVLTGISEHFVKPIRRMKLGKRRGGL